MGESMNIVESKVKQIMLFASGSFNPPTNMHFRLFEVAKTYLNKLPNTEVIGGVMSPVHSSYKKRDLVDSKHRLQMLKLGLHESSWIKVSDWECNQDQWTRTRDVLSQHQKFLDECHHSSDWIPASLKDGNSKPKIMFLCGGDLLESFSVPDLWNPEDIRFILQNFGLVVITREGSNPHKFIYESDLLSEHSSNIEIVNEWISNDISSTKIRRAVRRNEPIQYLLPDPFVFLGRNRYIFNLRRKHCMILAKNSIRSSHKLDDFMDFAMNKFKNKLNKEHFVKNHFWLCCADQSGKGGTIRVNDSQKKYSKDFVFINLIKTSKKTSQKQEIIPLKEL